jgi:hypothetical protein
MYKTPNSRSEAVVTPHDPVGPNIGHEGVSHASYFTLRSLMPSVRGNLLLAASLVVAELIMACAVGFSIWPFLLCAVLFLLGIGAVLRMEGSKPRTAARGANFICVLLVMKVCFLLVAGTGGATSNFTGILYVPIFLAALFYFIPGSVGVGASFGQGSRGFRGKRDFSCARGRVFVRVSGRRCFQSRLDALGPVSDPPCLFTAATSRGV